MNSSRLVESGAEPFPLMHLRIQQHVVESLERFTAPTQGALILGEDPFHLSTQRDAGSVQPLVCLPETRKVDSIGEAAIGEFAVELVQGCLSLAITVMNP